MELVHAKVKKLMMLQLTRIRMSSKTVVHTAFNEAFGSPGKKFIVI
jgi:hypothetical protein